MSKKQEYEVTFNEVYGKNTKVNLSGTGFVKASDVHEAETLARMDFYDQEWTDVVVDWPDEEGDAGANGMKDWVLSFHMKGKNGNYGGVTDWFQARTDSSARNKVLKDLRKGGLTFGSDGISMSAIERIGFEKK